MLARRFAVSLLALTLVVCAGCANPGARFLGKPAPETRFTLLDGDYIPLKKYRGKTVVLIFWAQWCHSSGPAMKRLQEYAAQLGRSDVVFLAVSLDEVKDITKLKERIVYQHLDNFQHAFSGNAGSDEAFVAFDGTDLPYIFIIDPQGVVQAVGTSDSTVYDFFAPKA